MTKENSFETIVNVCCHRVELRYFGFGNKLTDELKNILTEHGEERAKECIAEGCASGELNCLYVNKGKDYEIRGWWEIAN